MKLDRNVIYSTTEYSQFILVKGNRNVRKKGKTYNNLKASMMSKGLLTPIIIDDNFVVADGQHRLEVCKELSIPIEFIYRQGSTNTIITLNVDRRSWVPEEYLANFVTKAIPSYCKFLKMKTDSGLSINAVYALLKGREVDAEVFKSGKMTISLSEEKSFVKLWPLLQELITLDESRFKKQLSKTRVMSTLVKLVTNSKYNHEHFKRRLSNEVRIASVSKAEDAIVMLETIYNKNLKKNDRIFLNTK